MLGFDHITFDPHVMGGRACIRRIRITAAPETAVGLAVERLCTEDFWQAWRVAEAIIPARSVDLVDLETAGESVRLAMQRHGIAR